MPGGIVEQHIAALNERDMDALLGMVRSDTVWLMPDGTTLRGPGEVQQCVRALWEAFPDARWELDAHVATERAAALEASVSGTHLGTLRMPAGDIPATGRPVKVRYAAVVTLEGGRITSRHLYWDLLQMLNDLGISAQPAGARGI